MIKTFQLETKQCASYLEKNPDNKVYRYPEKIVVFTGDDIPPDNLDDLWCDMGAVALADHLAESHPVERVNAWLGKYA